MVVEEKKNVDEELLVAVDTKLVFSPQVAKAPVADFPVILDRVEDPILERLDDGFVLKLSFDGDFGSIDEDVVEILCYDNSGDKLIWSYKSKINIIFLDVENIYSIEVPVDFSFEEIISVWSCSIKNYLPIRSVQHQEIEIKKVEDKNVKSK